MFFTHLLDSSTHILPMSESIVQALHNGTFNSFAKKNQRIGSKINRSHLIRGINQYSKAELYKMVNDLLKAFIDQQSHQEKRIEDLLRMISTIQINPDFHPIPVESSDTEDPFHHLIMAAHLLQKEALKVMGQFQSLHTTLEREVESRTRELNIKQANLNSVIESTSDMIVSVDFTGRILVLNSAFQQFVWEVYKTELSPGDNLIQSLPKAVKQYWEPFFKQALEGKAFKSVTEFLVEDETRFYEYSFNPIYDSTQAVTGFSFFSKDITQQQLAIRELKKQQQLLASINYSIKEGIFRSSLDEGIIYVNKAFAEMFGYDSVEDIMKVEPYELYVDTSRRDDFVRMIREKESFTNEEVLFKRKDGTTFWGLMSSIRSEDDKGNIIHDGAIRDVTQMREAERLLKENYEELKKVNAELDRFVYSTSHDLRAPLASISGLINITRTETDEKLRLKYLGLMEKSINKLDNFIKDIIGYSRNSRMDIGKDEIDFQQIIDDAFDSLTLHIGDKKIEKRVSIRTERPFYSDSTRLGIIFSNIISNAIRYSDPEKKIPFIDINIEVREDGALINIKDNGIGIEQKFLSKIFEMFYRATQKSNGSGIGLYIVKEAIEKLKGEISVDSTFGMGTTFCMLLPHQED